MSLRVDLLTLLWTCSALYGIRIGLRNVRRNQKKRKLLYQMKLNGVRQLSVTAIIRRETIRLIIQFSVLFVGIGSMLGISWILYLVGPLLVLNQIGVVVNTKLEEFYDHKMNVEIHKMEARLDPQLLQEVFKQMREGTEKEERDG